MADEGGLWDDSMLTKAFDQAMSKYKKMHIKGYEESAVVSVEAKDKEVIPEAIGSIGIDGDTSSQMLKAAEDNQTLEFQVPQVSAEVPNGIPMQDQTQIHSSTEGLEDYDLLCKQYYELEEKRGQIWEKLKQYGHSDYSYPVGTSDSCMQWPSTSASQNQYNSGLACCPALAISCCQNSCPYTTTSCSLPACSSGYSGNENADIITKGMEAAQKALSKLKENASDCQLDSQNEPNTNTGQTDLSEVLNAWYSAGLYTGKYLTEKSLTKPRNG